MAGDEYTALLLGFVECDWIRQDGETLNLPPKASRTLDFELKPRADASTYALCYDIKNLTLEQGDAYQLKHDNAIFDAVVCQTVLTHVCGVEAIIKEMVCALKSSGYFTVANYDSVHFNKRDETWCHERYRIDQLFMKGKMALGH